MAITVAMRTEITQLYVALFGRAPDSEGLGYWVGLRNSGQSLTQIANTMFATEPARAIYPSWYTNGEIIASFYVNVLGRTADPEGLAFWTAKLNAAGATPGSVITQLIDNVANYTGTDANGLLSQKLFNNSVTVAQYYAEHGGNIANAFAVLDGVTDQAGSVTTAIAAINNGTIGGSGGPQTLTLTVGQDGLSSGSANDMFVANVAQNQLGLQVNTLGSGDTLNGGAGTDTLMAKVTAGAFAGADWVSMPIQPMTSGIEMVKLEAVNFDIRSDNYRDSTTVYVNAKDMLGVNTIGSWHSDANLVIQNMTTQDNNGVGRELADMTVLMGYTGNSDSHWDESDLAVYFDQDYLNPSISFTKPSVDIRLMNEDKYDVDYVAGLRGNAIEALAGVYIEKLVITINGVGYALAPYVGEKGAPNSDPKTDFIKTYPQLLAAVQAAVVAVKAAFPNDAALQTLQAVDGGEFLADISPVTGLRRIGESVSLSVDGSTNGVANTIVVQAQDLVLDPIQTTPIPNSNRFERAEATPAVPSTELSINVDLEKVGLAGDGGQLLVGSMFKDGRNHWSDLYDGKGIAVFDVTVSGGSDKPSSLSGMHSTGNNLREVNVTTNAAQTGTFADLTIGNSNTGGFDFLKNRVAKIGDVITPMERNANALKDVQTFNAAGLKGDLTLFAALTDEVTAKYMNLMDAAPDAAAADNVVFTYTGGSGNDYINLWLDAANLAYAGTTTREDFVLTINGGAGNDEIVTMIGDGSSESFGEDQGFLVDNWYINSKINANLTVSGGDGNDTIRTLGAGDWIINGNTGNDTIYADNTGGQDLNKYSPGFGFNDGRAVYVFNAADGNAFLPGNQYYVDDLQSQAAASVSVVNANLMVTFRGLTSTVVSIGGSVGSLTNVTITDLSVNQAIKAAINLDPVLSKLLVAEDGPGRTLIVRSLIDGADVGAADLGITFGTVALSTGQLAVAGLVQFAPAGSALLTDGYVPTNFADSSNAGTSAAAGVNEVFTANFAGTESGGNTTVTFDGVTVTLAPGVGGAALAADYVSKYMSLGNEVATTWNAVATGSLVTFTSELPGFRPNTYSFAVNDAAVITPADTTPVTVTAVPPPTTDGTAATSEVQNVLVSGVATGPVTFLGALVAGSANLDTAADIVLDIIADAANVIATWNAANPTRELASITAGPGVDDLDLTYAITEGNVVVIPGDTTNGITFAPSTETTAGVAGTAEVFDATFAGTEVGSNTTVLFDGVTVTLAAGVGGAALAADFVTKYMSVANEGTTTWNAVAAGAVVTFTAETAGIRPDVTTADFTVTDTSGSTFDPVPVVVTQNAPTTEGVDAIAASGPIIGAESESLSDNTITGGTGNDVIVLGTTGYMDPGLPPTGSNDTVVYNAAFGNDVIVNFDSTIFPATTIVTPAPAVKERITVTFSASDGTPVAETIIFDGDTITLSAPVVAGVIPAADVANQFADQFGTANWVVQAFTPGSNVVTLERVLAGDFTPNATAANFTGTYFGAGNGNGTVTVATTQEGVTSGLLGGPTTFTVEFDTLQSAAVAAGSFTFDGQTVNYAAGDGSITFATKLGAALFPNWTVSLNLAPLNPQVTFTANVNGVSTPGTAANFDVDSATLSDGVIGQVIAGATGSVATGTFVTTVVPAGPGEGVDYLDFRGIGGDLDVAGANFQSLVLDKSIVVAAQTTANDSAAEVAALFTDSATAITHVYVAYDVNNVGSVYSVSDAAGTGARVATLMGTIDLADTPWGTLTAVNFL